MRNIVNKYQYVCFTGSRGHAIAEAEAHAVCPFVRKSAVVSVGDAQGVDMVVRRALPDARIYNVQFPAIRYSYAMRTTRLIQAQPPSFAVLCAFPSGICPAKVRARKTFAGHGSGTWGAVALALYRGMAVLVFVPTHGQNLLGQLRRHFTQQEVTNKGTWFFAPCTDCEDLFHPCPSPDPLATSR